MLLPSGARRLFARGWSSHSRSRIVPGHARLTPASAAMSDPKSRKTPSAVNPAGSDPFVRKRAADFMR